MLGVVQEDKLQVIQAQEAQTALNALLDAHAVEGPAARVAAHLSLEHVASRQPTPFTQHDTDTALAFTVPIGGRRINVVNRAGENGSYGRQRDVLRHAVAEYIRHITKWRAAHG